MNKNAMSVRWGRLLLIITVILTLGLSAVIGFGAVAGTRGTVVQLQVETPNGVVDSNIHALVVVGTSSGETQTGANPFTDLLLYFGYGMTSLEDAFTQAPMVRSDITSKDGAQETNTVAAVSHYLTTGARPSMLGWSHPRDLNVKQDISYYWELPDSAYDYRVLDEPHNGTSASIAKALAMYATHHALRPDLKIAATGSIDAYVGDNIRPVGSTMTKADAAVEAGMDLFLYPSDTCLLNQQEEFKENICGQPNYKGMRTVGVKTLQEALAYLGAPDTQPLPAVGEMLIQPSVVTLPAK